MIQLLHILAISSAIFIGMHLIFAALHICAAFTFKGKIRSIDKFIGFFNEDYTRVCNKFIEARAEMKQRR